MTVAPDRCSTQLDELHAVAASVDATTQRLRAELNTAILAAHDGGLTQRQIAGAIRRSQPEVARRLADARARATRSWMTAGEHGVQVRARLDDGDQDFAFRLVMQALAQLARLERADDLGRFLGREPRTGDVRWDTLLRAAIGWRCRVRGISAPGWVRPAPLQTWWFVRPEPALIPRQLQMTPPDLIIVGVWCDAASLESV